MDEKTGSRRYEICCYCGGRWNVSRTAELPPEGYICPHCRGKLRRGEI